MHISPPTSSDPDRFLTEDGEPLARKPDAIWVIPEPTEARPIATSYLRLRLKIDFPALAADLRAIADAIEGAGQLRDEPDRLKDIAPNGDHDEQP